MTDQALTVIDTPELLEGEPGHAWAWVPQEPGCPLLSNPPQPQPAASAAQHRENQS